MTTLVRERNGITIVDIEGQIKGADSQQLARVIEELAAKKQKRIGMNFLNVGFIDSSCIGALMALKMQTKEDDVEFLVYNLSEDVQDLFEMTNMNKVFEILCTEDEVMARIGESG